MNFRHTRNGDIRINDIVYDVADILAVDPQYTLPSGIEYTEMDDNPRVFDGQGNQFAAPPFYKKMVAEIVAKLADIKAAKDTREKAVEEKGKADERERLDAMTITAKRQMFYNDNNITMDRFLLAIMQKEFDGDSRELNKLKEARNIVRANKNFPKEGN